MKGERNWTIAIRPPGKNKKLRKITFSVLTPYHKPNQASGCDRFFASRDNCITMPEVSFLTPSETGGDHGLDDLWREWLYRRVDCA